MSTQPNPYTPASGQIMEFDGGAFTYVGTLILGQLVTICTFGLAYPFALVLVERWRAKHTILLGKRLRFTGSAAGLFGRWVLWLVLILITVGIYAFWVVPRITRWKVENTRFAV